MWGINNQTKYVFYYDESNNCRKFWVDDSKQQFNTDHTADFVLAGLVRKEEEKVEAFCNGLLFLLGSRREMKEEEKFLAGMLARAAESDELVFLHDNEDYVMQENYAEFYTDPIRKYQKSRHIFDEETTVQDIVQNELSES